VQQEDRLAVMCAWNGLVVFVSMLILTGDFIKSTAIGAFVLVSCVLGFGRRWLLRGGFAVSVLAIAVWVGAVPHPDQWTDLFREVRAYLETRTNMVRSSLAVPQFAPFRSSVSVDQPADPVESRR
jgi:hypothetical protein